MYIYRINNCIISVSYGNFRYIVFFRNDNIYNITKKLFVVSLLIVVSDTCFVRKCRQNLLTVPYRIDWCKLESVD